MDRELELDGVSLLELDVSVVDKLVDWLVVGVDAADTGAGAVELTGGESLEEHAESTMAEAAASDAANKRDESARTESVMCINSFVVLPIGAHPKCMQGGLLYSKVALSAAITPGAMPAPPRN